MIRRLNDDERTLWVGVTRSIAPLRRRSRKPLNVNVTVEAAPARPSPTPKPIVAPRPVRTLAAPPPLEPLGRRFKQEVSRGRRAIDGRLDLHGMTQAQAHSALLEFLRAAQARGDRVVLVITGKGARVDDYASERGVLRRHVPRWLRLPEFRSHIIGFEEAHIGHGGEGALYVRLRRGRE